MVETISFISQLRNNVSLKLGFDRWHFYEMMDSFERALAYNLFGVIVIFYITVSCSRLLFEIAVVF